MKRWFIARMITDPEEPSNIVPAVARYTGDFRVWSSPAGICVGQCAFQNLGPLQADPDVHIFPDQMLLDFRWDSIGAGARNAALAKCVQFGFSTSGIGPNASNRDVLHSLIHQLQPGINVEQGDVRDPWG
jgi:hypothetical protein